MSPQTEGAMIAMAAVLVVILGANAALSMSITVPEPPPPPAPPEPVKAVVLAVDCLDCYDLSPFVDQLWEGGVVFSNKTVLDAHSDEAQSLIQQHGIQRLPALIVSGSIKEHLDAATVRDLFEPSVDGWQVFSTVPPPYVDVTTGETRGLVSAQLLTVDCEGCYDVNAHRKALGQFGISPDYETLSVDSAEGESLVERYAITAVPTVLLRGDVEVYAGFTDVWAGVGSVEEDGTYVFRNASLFGTYYDLEGDAVVGG